MIPRARFDVVTEQDLHDLIYHGVRESRTLDYKPRLGGERRRTDRDRTGRLRVRQFAQRRPRVSPAELGCRLGNPHRVERPRNRTEYLGLPIHLTQITAPPIYLEDFEVDQLTVLRPAFDVLWNAVSVAHSQTDFTANP
jgi:hypothetical protein